ncbi:CMGC/RCK protein kinase [Saprolegnia diclina VS20]|uniref:CMGC/RCK protein kinase n=1 Tax=Saprolegnia diclina (strain VS20) TaxID=1156394 RepID=T0RHX6_SAPDV|nr:CMGC/RCK protein kinase [Saprolegnia diclina VS20]EQC31908.1 CMGC/RCK protein kinase [Saprolegnia diclina VS20]|eukprot:XP_008614636.1 CMGC/RCK protein kinase [Saprolegnia diclina VS20]
MRKYRLVSKKGEGTFSEVLKAQNVKDSKYHAIKCMKNHFESIDQVNNLREIQALRRLSPHPHIIKLEEVLYDQPSGRLALVFELMDANLYEMIRGRRTYLNPELIRSLMYQLVKSLDHMHNKGIFHRDIKPENILVENNEFLKLADFGSCRGIYSKQPYTEYISTRWYRAPECLLTDGYYGPEMDLWGVGCVFFEITSLYPLFPGSNELDQINRIHKILGTPLPDVLDVFRRKGAAHIDFNFAHDDGTSIAKLIPHASPEAVDLMCKMLVYDPSKRTNAREALRHEYFREMREIEEAALAAAQDQLPKQPSVPAANPPPAKHRAKGAKDDGDKVRPLPMLAKPHEDNEYSMDGASEKESTAYEINELPPINASMLLPNAAKGTKGVVLPDASKKKNIYRSTNVAETTKARKPAPQAALNNLANAGGSIASYKVSSMKAANNPSTKANKNPTKSIGAAPSGAAKSRRK